MSGDCQETARRLPGDCHGTGTQWEKWGNKEVGINLTASTICKEIINASELCRSTL
jgi:hypothetical protein